MLYIVQQDEKNPPGSTLEWCKNNNREFQILCMTKGDLLPPLISDLDQVIICGGSMNVDEEHLYSWLKAEKHFIHQCLNKKVKILGLCLGGQLLAEALGARVSKHSHWEVGWWPVQLGGILTSIKNTSELEVFQWHGYSFDTPKLATSIATNPICKHQGFIYDNFAVGLQFHPESTKEWIKECADTSDYPNGTYVQNKIEIYQQMAKQDHLKEWYFNFLDYFF